MRGGRGMLFILVPSSEPSVLPRLESRSCSCSFSLSKNGVFALNFGGLGAVFGASFDRDDASLVARDAAVEVLFGMNAAAELARSCRSGLESTSAVTFDDVIMLVRPGMIGARTLAFWLRLYLIGARSGGEAGPGDV